MTNSQDNAMPTICGRTPDEIRKAYFKQKLPALLNEIQAEASWPKSEIESLGLYLESLRTEEATNLKTVQEMFGGKIVDLDDPKPPTVEQLTATTPGKEIEMKAWQESVDKARVVINQIRTAANTAVIKKTPVKKDDWLDWALQIETLKRWLMEEAVWKEQLYRRRLTQIKDSYNISRAEAEERAKITEEYRNFRNAQNEVDSLTEIVLICKKRGGQDF